MSRFLSEQYSCLSPYVPGEQPTEKGYTKLNTNESPFPPAPAVQEAVDSAVPGLNLYPDPQAGRLVSALCGAYGVSADKIIVGNGSDELLSFAFMAFGARHGVVYPDISYGFYKVYADLYGLCAEEVPLCADYSVNADDYIDKNRMIVIANPNAPTGMVMPLSDIARIAASNPDDVVLVDEAYGDFWGQSAIELTAKYDNLLIMRTFSKSRNMAGMRIGFAIGSAELIADMQRIRNSINPYNLSGLAIAAGEAAVKSDAYYKECVGRIVEVRDEFAGRLRGMGFRVLPSCANFFFVSTHAVPGKYLYEALGRRRILVRHFDAVRIKEFVRITVGTKSDMESLEQELTYILKEVML